MLLQHLLFVCACTIASTHAAVKFYGSERPEGDYVTCEVANATDEDVSAGLGMLYFPGEIVPESNDLQFADEPLVCGDFASVAVEFACSDLGGDAICVPTHTADEAEEDPAGSDDKSAEAVEERSLPHLEKRAAASCNQWTLVCTNEYQSTAGGCASDYTKRYYDVEGSTSDVWCTKPCTKDERAACESKECTKGKAKCEKFGHEHDCAKGLTKCAGFPVKMPESSCTTKYMSRAFTNICKKEGPACVVYEDGACTLDAGRWKTFTDYVDEAFGLM